MMMMDHDLPAVVLFPLQIKSIRKVNSDRFDFRDTTLAGAYTACVHSSGAPIRSPEPISFFLSPPKYILQKAFGNLNLAASPDVGHGYVFPDISVHSKANKETHNTPHANANANPRRTPAIIVSFVP